MLTNTYKHYLFDISMFTHLNILTAQAFTTGETVTGGTSGAVHTIRLIDLTNFDDGFGDNDNFETEADSILDFSEGNPFGQP